LFLDYKTSIDMPRPFWAKELPFWSFFSDRLAKNQKIWRFFYQ